MIKFRAKRVDNGEWVYGNLIVMTDKVSYVKGGIFSNTWIMEIEDDLSVSSLLRGCTLWTRNICIQVLPETVAMYTTINDKNNVEIYGSIETNGKMSKGGDIVKIKRSRWAAFQHTQAFAEIVWSAYFGGWQFLEFIKPKSPNRRILTGFNQYAKSDIEVIGNQYDDSKLLEKK